MRIFFKINLFVLCCLFAAGSKAQDAHKFLRKGDNAYEGGNYPDAELNYRRALEEANSAKGSYNLGNSTYRQERYDEAVRHFQSAAEAAKDRKTKAQAFHNLGNAYFQNGKFKESIEAYKNALRLNPDDLDTKRNLANALRRLPPPSPQNQQTEGQAQNDQQQKEKNQEQQKNQEGQGQPNQQEQQDGQDNENEEEEQSSQPSGSEKSQPQDLSKEEARQLLEIMDQEEQKVQQKLRRAQGKKKKSDKDW